MSTTLTHISLLVEDVQKALHFYQDNLGLEVIENLGNYATLKVNENLKLSFFPRIAMQEALPSVQLSPVYGSQEESMKLSLMSNGCGHFVPPLFQSRLGWMGDSTQGGSQ